MFKEVLSSIEWFNTWAIISMIIFVIFFIGLIVRVILFDKNYFKYMGSLPLENEDNNNQK